MILMDFYGKLASFKADNGLTFEDLGKPLNLKKDAMRMAVNNKKLNPLQVKELTRYFRLDNEVEDSFFESVKDIALKEKIRDFGQFFSENEKEVLKNPTVSNIIEKQVAKRLLKLVQDKTALEDFLDN